MENKPCHLLVPSFSFFEVVSNKIMAAVRQQWKFAFITFSILAGEHRCRPGAPSHSKTLKVTSTPLCHLGALGTYPPSLPCPSIAADTESTCLPAYRRFPIWNLITSVSVNSHVTVCAGFFPSSALYLHTSHSSDVTKGWFTTLSGKWSRGFGLCRFWRGRR